MTEYDKPTAWIVNSPYVLKPAICASCGKEFTEVFDADLSRGLGPFLEFDADKGGVPHVAMSEGVAAGLRFGNELICAECMWRGITK